MTPEQIFSEFERLMAVHNNKTAAVIEALIVETFQLRAVAGAALGVDEWHYLPELPDDLTALLVARENDGFLDVDEGYLDAGVWYYQGGPDAEPIRMSGVYAWRDMIPAPQPPPRHGSDQG